MKTAAKEQGKKQGKRPDQGSVDLAKLILREWGRHCGPVTPQGLRTIGSALRTLKRAYL